MKPFEYFEPQDIESAVALLAKHRGAKLLAGGTDLIPQMKKGLTTPANLISLHKLSGLRRIEEGPEGLKIGAMATLGLLERNPILSSRYPALQTAIGHVSSRSIRNAATLGGNVCLDTKCIYRDQPQTWGRALPACLKMGGRRCYLTRGGKLCHASLASETAPVLVALQGRVKLFSPREERFLPIDQLYTGDGIYPLALRPEEMLGEILLPPPSENTGSSYLRSSFRKAIDFPVASSAIRLEIRGGRCREARVVLGAIAPQPIRLKEVENDLTNEPLSESLFRDCARKAPEEALQASRSLRIDGFVRQILSHLVYQGLVVASQTGN